MAAWPPQTTSRHRSMQLCDPTEEKVSFARRAASSTQGFFTCVFVRGDLEAVRIHLRRSANGGATRIEQTKAIAMPNTISGDAAVGVWQCDPTHGSAPSGGSLPVYTEPSGRRQLNLESRRPCVSLRKCLTQNCQDMVSFSAARGPL